MSYLLTDMHCHLDFATDPTHVAEMLLKDKVALFSNTVNLAEWETCTREFDPYPNITLGYGWHPWWITDSSSTELLKEQLELFQPDKLGEIGLDFGQRHVRTKDQQVAIFKVFAEWAARKTGCLLSIHAVNAAADSLAILDQHNVFEANTCIYHWFSGTSNDLKRALEYGCFFSVNQRMLASKKGREYVKQIPLDRLLLESDLPSEPHSDLTASALTQNLQQCAQLISGIKGTNCAALLNETAQRLLNMTRA